MTKGQMEGFQSLGGTGGVNRIGRCDAPERLGGRRGGASQGLGAPRSD